ncbi:hypothetical protein DPEC_G00327900 [Dallia pectoralis]|uniref:Uncharacterized protein n=1 Tax=Dallia pectoralis TaxID=75939 RepID=A0ACC2F8H9_DALPE|nr:hypothetical protein DPEC_G00327900 [Dallia pectoralis]
MAATLCGRLLPKQGWQPLVQSVRHGSKAVTRHRKPMHILKQKLMAITEYIPPKPAAPPGALTPRAKPVQEESGLVLLMKKELQTIFQECRMIAVIQNNSIKSEDMLHLKHRLCNHGIAMKFFPNQVIRSFLAQSPYVNMEPLFIGPNVLFVSKEPKVKEMLLSLRTSPQMVLVGACVERTLMSRQGVLNYAKLPSVTVVQGELVSGLTILTSQLTSLIQHHPAHLTLLLQQYLEQQAGEASAEVEPEESPANV